jgi:Secretion system C-terminal sorting domain
LVVNDGVNSDSINKTTFVTVSNPGVGIALPFQENFDSNVFPPNGITIFNADGGLTWELDSNAFVSANHSVKINNLINTNYGTIDEIVLPYLDFSSLGSTPFMRFDWAYAKSDPLFSDEMIVQLSTDCGNTWNQVFYRTNTQLASGPTQTTPFIPDSSQWKAANIVFSAYSSEQYVAIKIMNVTDGGNNLYIDNINIGDINVGIEEIGTEQASFSMFPNPAANVVQFNYSLISPNDRLQIYSASGQLIQEYTNLPSTISIEDFAPGIYYINYYSNEGMVSDKLIIIND